MQKGHSLQFDCISCSDPVRFSLFQRREQTAAAQCSTCGKEYVLDDPDLMRQLSKFEALCRQIAESEEILGNTSVGIDVGPHHVKIPFKLLLTRFNSSIDLTIGNTPVAIQFRFEPQKDLPPVHTKDTA